MSTERTSLFLCGDVMLGRGVDQVLPDPVEPTLYERWADSAQDYVRLAEQAHGAIDAPLGLEAIWGEGLAELAARDPDARIVNLETSVTRHDEPWPRKGIHYRMSPANAATLQAAGIDACTLANNHVLDWGREGLAETLATLEQLEIATVGAGDDLAAAQQPARLGRVLLFGFGMPTSGIPSGWAATDERSGVAFLPDASRATRAELARIIAPHRQEGDLVVASLHWGGNWGWAIPQVQQTLAHALIEEAGVDVVHGHSSHHVKGIEVYRDRLILYGCGDLLTDYEGISGHERFRGDLGLMYFPVLGPDGALQSLTMTPTTVRKMQLRRATGDDAQWLRDTLREQCDPLGTGVEQGDDGRLAIAW